jgi:cell division septal protein FtsQ
MQASPRVRRPPAAARREPRVRTSSLESATSPELRGAGRGLAAAGFWWWCLAKLGALAVLLGATTLLYHIATSSSYYVSDVSVEGNRLLIAQEVVDAAAVSGVHILWVNGRQTSQRLLSLPAVESADVQVLFPRRVAVRVVERVPYAQWQVGSGTFLVDESGRVIGPAPRDSAFPLLRESRSGTLRPGDYVPAEAVRAAAQLSESLPGAWRPASGGFEYDSDSGVSLTTRAGWRVRFGDDSDLPLKLAAFQALAAEIERVGARVQVVDVRFPGRPYYR